MQITYDPVTGLQLAGTLAGTDIADGSITSAKIVDGTIVDGDVATANKDGTAATPSLRTIGAVGDIQALVLGGAATAGTTLKAGDAGHKHTVSATYAQTALGADVTLTNAGTYYDGPAVTLSVGTWLLTGQIMIAGPNTNFYIKAHLWDGTTTAVEDFQTVIGTLWGTISQSCIVVVASGTPSWRMSGLCQSPGAKIYATPYSNLCAVKIA